MSSRRRHCSARDALGLLCAKLVLLANGIAYAQAPTTDSGGRTQITSLRLEQCAACHGTDGNSALANNPSLAGQPRVFIENTLIMIREGLRPIAAKQGLLAGLSDAEIVAIAEHFSTRATRAASTPRNEAAFSRGEEIASRALCGTCHLPNYVGQQQMPRLAGQREDYLFRSMREFRDNRAQGRDTMMNGVLRGFSDRNLSDMAHYFAHLP